MTRLFHHIYIACALAIATLAGSCTMIEDSVDYCPTGLYVRFVYDYNTMRADMLKDHVGHVRLYLYDEQGRKVAERAVSNNSLASPLSQYGYAIHFNPAELRPGRYRLQAVAMQRDWDEALSRPGAKYRHENAIDRGDDMRLTLDHQAEPIPGTAQHLVDHASMPLDTLWHTLKVQAHAPADGTDVPPMHRTVKPYSVYPLEEQYVTVTDNMATYATVSLIRDTKHINIILRQLDYPDNIFHQQYEVTIADVNGTVLHDNALDAATDSLRYTPYAAWTTRFTSGGVVIDPTDPDAPSQAAPRLSGKNPAQAAPSGETPSSVSAIASSAKNPSSAPSRASSPNLPNLSNLPNLLTADSADPANSDDEAQRAAHYNLMCNRLIYDSDPSRAAILRIRNRNSGKTVATVNLPYMLAEGRAAYELYGYSPQEYLDREFNYQLHFFLKGDTWAYCDIVINVLSWSKRKQNTEL